MRIFRRINSSKHPSGRKNSGKLVHLRGYLFLLQRHLAVKETRGIGDEPERGMGNRQIQI